MSIQQMLLVSNTGTQTATIQMYATTVTGSYGFDPSTCSDTTTGYDNGANSATLTPSTFRGQTVTVIKDTTKFFYEPELFACVESPIDSGGVYVTITGATGSNFFTKITITNNFNSIQYFQANTADATYTSGNTTWYWAGSHPYGLMFDTYVAGYTVVLEY